MSLSFLDHGAQRLPEFVKPGMLCAFDFDGTLAPIVKDPQQAIMPPAISRRMRHLSELARVAVISERAVADVGMRLDFLPEFMVGNHGIEGLPGLDNRAEQFHALCLDWERKLALALADRVLFDAGIWIENKGCSLSVHYRLASNRVETEDRLRQLLFALLPTASVVAGKCVFHLLPPEVPDKGAAVARLCSICDAPSVIYVGDDVTDEQVFRQRRKDWLTVRIEQCDDSAAQFHLHHRLDMMPLLDALINHLSSVRRAAPAVQRPMDGIR